MENNLHSSEHDRRVRFEMPRRLVLVRHGESEANIINRAMKKGEMREYPPGFQEIPDREFRLSDEGRRSTERTGQWLAREYPQGMDVIYVSDHIRAQETAALVCLAAGWDRASIRIDPQLGERNWGRFAQSHIDLRNEVMAGRKRDPLHTPMPDGETLLEAKTRARVLLDRAAREFSGKKVLVFTHGEYIEAIWSEIGHFSTEEQRTFFASDAGDIRNCQIVEFASEHPENGEWIGKLRWVRSSCPHRGLEGAWGQLVRKTYSPEEMLRRVEGYKKLNHGNE